MRCGGRVVSALLLLAALAASLLASVSDARSRIIPNGSCLCVACAGLALQALRAWMPTAAAALPVEATLASSLPAPVSCVIAGTCALMVGGAGELLVRRMFGRPGVGMGDVKLCAAWACWLGWLALPAICAACLAGAMVALVRGQRAFAMGPWLTAAFALACVAPALFGL